jgi:predicted membrane protein
MDYLKVVIEQMGFPAQFVWLFVLILIWSYAWKLLALWKSARRHSVVWFIVLALINTVGILEILYIFVFSEMKLTPKKKIKTRPKKRKKRRR